MAKRIVNKKLLEELDSLQNEKKSLDYLGGHFFKTKKEFEKYKNNNLDAFTKLIFIKNRIKEIEFELMSDTEKKEREIYLKKLKNKFTPPS